MSVGTCARNAAPTTSPMLYSFPPLGDTTVFFISA
jgi:hypothetical protein